MKAILEFNLPDENFNYMNAVFASNWRQVVNELDDWLRNEKKYQDNDIIATSDVRSKIFELMNDNGVSLH